MCDKDLHLSKECCVWDKFFKDLELYNKSVVFACIFSLLCVSFLSVDRYRFNFMRTTTIGSYKYFYNFVQAMAYRLILPRVCIFYQLTLDAATCEFCAFIESLVVVYEIETLTHVCIDRYVTAKYIKEGLPIKKSNYSMYRIISSGLSSLYASTPFVTSYFGSYGFDFSCTTCTLNNVLPDNWTKYTALGLFFMRSVKPVFFMVVMLYWARKYEKSFDEENKKRSEALFTKSMISVTMVNLVCWAPMAYLRSYVLVSQVYYGKLAVPSQNFVNVSFFMYELSPALTMMALLMTNVNLVDIYERMASVVRVDDLDLDDIMTPANL